MKRIFLLLLVAVSSLAVAQESWLGLFMKNKKIGYSSNLIRDDKLNGAAVKRSDTHTLIIAGLMGTSMTMDMKSSTWTSEGKPKRMVFRMESSGRILTIDATFLADAIDVDVTNGGAKSRRSIPLPKDGAVVDDALTAMLTSGKPADQSRTYYVLDPITVGLVKNTVTMVGPAKVDVQGKSVDATRLDIAEVRATTKVYLDSKGEIVKAEGPMGIEMIPLTKAQALAPGDGSAGPDLADVSSLKPDKDIPDPETVRTLKLRVIGRDLSHLPSGDHQTVAQSGEAWTVAVHPVQVTGLHDDSIASAAKAKPNWVQPAVFMPSQSPQFKKLASAIVGPSKTVLAASRKIQQYVHDRMRFNSGIGVLRDATEVLRSKEGVCRDYAILTATLLRSAGIPARLASGIVYAGGRFYYHAWAEAWDGGKWFGVDSTRPARQITATHVKLADGNVDEAFAFTFLEDARIEVIGIGR